MKLIQPVFARVARLLKVEAGAKEECLSETQRANLLSNFGAIVLNGLFFPTAGKILGAGLLLTWFLDAQRTSFSISRTMPSARFTSVQTTRSSRCPQCFWPAAGSRLIASVIYPCS
jgi:hypothetical protein